MIKHLYNRHQQFIKYAFFGGMGVLSDITLYTLLIILGINYQIANAVGYLTGTLLSFILNRHYTFDARDYVLKRLITFLSVAFVGYFCSVLLLYAFVQLAGIHAILAKILTLGLVFIIQFTLNKRITFKKSNQ